MTPRAVAADGREWRWRAGCTQEAVGARGRGWPCYTVGYPSGIYAGGALLPPSLPAGFPSPGYRLPGGFYGFLRLLTEAIRLGVDGPGPYRARPSASRPASLAASSAARLLEALPLSLILFLGPRALVGPKGYPIFSNSVTFC